MGFIWSIIIGIVAGYLAGKIMRGGGFGVIVNLILGRSYFVIMDRLAIQQIQRGLRRRAQLSNHILHGNKISRNFSYGII